MKLVPDTQTRMYVVIFFALLLLCSCLGRPYQIQTAGESIDTGRVVLLIHGLGSSPKIWTPAIQDLVGNAFSAPVVTFQYPSGILAKKNVDPNPKVAHTLRRFLQTRSLRNKKFVIIAHSNGSLVALNYISQFHSDHRVEALALLAPPMFGSKVADLLDPLPDNLVGTQSGALRFLNPDLIELHARIHKTRKYFPKTFVALGSNDKLAVVETGALPYRFARNYKFPLNHSQLRELDKQPELMQLLKDFVDGTPAPSTITSTDAPSQLLLRIPNLMQLVFYQNGYIRKEPSDESLSKQGFVPFEPPSWDSITDQKGGLTFADLERTARNLESTQIQVPLRIGIQKCANGNCATELIDVKQEKKELKRKYDLSFAVRKSPSQILWVSSLSAANKSAREKNGDYLPWGEEFNFMTWEQVQKELADDGVQSALQIEQFDPDVNGPEQIHFRHHLAGVLRKAFAYKRLPN